MDVGIPMHHTTPRYAWVLAGTHDAQGRGDAPEPRSEFDAFLGRYGGTLFSLSSDGVPGPVMPVLVRRFALAAQVTARSQGFDAILASGEDIGVPLALASMLRRSRVPIHMMFHGHHLDSYKLRRLAPVLRRLEHVHFHCLSESLKARTQAVLGIPDERCHATGYGVDTRYFGGAAFAADGPIVSAGAANRDYPTLVAAAGDLPVDVRVAADSTWMPPDAADADMRWPANVDIRSYGDYANLRGLYARARFVVVPLHPAQHACGYAVVAEAMAMQRAVIVTRTDIPPDFLVPGITGLFTEPGDVAGLNATIQRLLDAPGEAAAMGRRAREAMQADHSLERYCERLQRIVARSMAEPARSAAILCHGLP